MTFIPSKSYLLVQPSLMNFEMACNQVGNMINKDAHSKDGDTKGEKKRVFIMVM